MTREERIRTFDSIEIIRHDILEAPGEVEKASFAMIAALEDAVGSLEEIETETRGAFDRQISMLRYHINNPKAVFLKDEYTIEALKVAIFGLENRIRRDKGGEC